MRKSTGGLREAIILAGFVIFVVILTSYDQRFGIEAWTRRFSEYSALRDAVITGTTILAFGLVIYAWRRQRELREEVAERTRAEEALRESEEKFRTVFEDAPIGVALVDLDGCRFRANRALCEMLGCSEEDLLEDYLEHIHPDDRQVSTEHFQRVLEEGAGSYTLERRYLHADGHVVWSLTSVSLIRDSEGNPSHFVCLHQDITERKRAEERLRQSEVSLAAAQERAHLGSWEWDISTDKLRWSDEHYRIFGHTPQSFTPTYETHYLNAIHPEDRERVERAINEAFEGKPYSIDYRIVRPDDEVRHVHSHGEVLFDEGDSKEPVGMAGTVQDITERKLAEEALKESEERFRSTFDEASIGMAVTGLDGRYVQVNRSLCEMLGRSEEELLISTFLDITHPEDLDVSMQHVQRLLEGGLDSYQLEKRYLHAEGHVVWVSLSASAVRDSEGHPLYYIAQIQDITERKRAEELLEHQAFHDLLTELPNRQLFVDRLEQTLRRTRRRPGSRVAVLFMDLDNFKVVNDSLGHEVGDRLLVAVGERLRRCLRPEDTFARFGGDEFTVLIEDGGNPEDAARVAERIIEALREPFVIEGRELYIKPSIGIALGEARTKSPEDLLRDADTAMYRAKEVGSGYRVFEPDMYEQALRRLRIDNELQRAIKSEEFVVHYQPIVDLQTEEVWGVEALVRWRHPERGLLDPKEFMPAAEESGLIISMGERVLKEACEQAIEWQERNPRIPPLVMAVNLSARQLQRPDLARTIEAVLQETGLKANCLSLDITETVYIKVLEGNTAALNDLKRMGVRLSIDDFGVGYSSLAYLKRLPADALKIDRSFIRALSEDIEDTVIIQMIANVAHTFGMEVVAEGVESAHQAEQLKEMGCVAQGYYFTEPLSPKAASEFLTR